MKTKCEKISYHNRFFVTITMKNTETADIFLTSSPFAYAFALSQRFSHKYTSNQLKQTKWWKNDENSKIGISI